MGAIYKITNRINGKVYIGQTTRSVERRWIEHQRSAYNNNITYRSLLYAAIRKYGKDAFTVETIEQCDDSLLNERERYWIKQYRSHENGYNIQCGGQGTIWHDSSDVMDLWCAGYAAYVIAKKLGISTQTVTKRLKDNGVTKYEITSRGNKAAAKGRKALRISADGADCVLYGSVRDAAAANHVTTSGICMACSGERNYAAGYRWVYYDENDSQKTFEPSPFKPHRLIPVHQYTLDGTYVRSYESMTKAAKAMGRTSVRTIIFACNSKRGYGYGFRWNYAKYDVLPKYKID